MLLLASVGCTPPSQDNQPTCDIEQTSPDYQAIETRCDGVDNDCDQVIDLLQPVEENLCQTEKPGACATGHFGCLDGKKACFVPPPVQETFDGIDNDCNGVIDDVPDGGARPVRALVLAPPYAWDESSVTIEMFVVMLDQLGIPHDIGKDKSDWDTAFSELQRYSLIVMPGYLDGDETFSPEEFEALTDFVSRGGVLVWQFLIPTDYSQKLLDLAGIESGEATTEAVRVMVDDEVEATLWLDTPEERDNILIDPEKEERAEVFVYQPATPGGALPFASAHSADGNSLGPTFLRRELGQGAIYTLGADLSDVTVFRCYVNCFDPGRDSLAMLLKGAFRESVGGHYALKHTIPGVQDSVLIVTHDVDAPDALLYSKDWGEPGALQMAKMEKKNGVKGTYFVTTDYVVGYYNPNVVTGLCELGMCPEGGHSVLHTDMAEMPKGTCDVNKDTYDAVNSPTVCGEILVCHELLYRTLPEGYHMYSWRTPYLYTPPDLWEILYNDGVLFDATMAKGDLKTNFPVFIKDFPLFQEWFRGLPMFEYPMNLEDGFSSMLPDGSESRVELKPQTLPRFMANWRYAMVENKNNNAWNLLLVHPSYGRGMGPENLKVKIGAVETAIELAKENDLLIENLTPLGFFSLGRQGTTIDIQYNTDSYEGTIHIGEYEAPRFSLEFGDFLESFEAPGAGEVELKDNRVVFKKTLPPNSSVQFTAAVAR